MKRRWLAGLVLASSFILGDAPAITKTSSGIAAAHEQGVRRFEAEVMSSYNRGNAAKAARHYAVNATVFIPGQPTTRGRDAIAANIARFMQDPSFKLDYENERLSVAASNDVAYSRGKLRVTYTDPQTRAPRTINSNYLLIMKRDPKWGWQIAEDVSF